METQFETALLILANNLGVTVEYMWTVLLRQAAVTALINILFVSFIVLLLLTTFTWLRRQGGLNNTDRSDLYSNHSDALWPFWFIVLVTTSLVSIPAIHESFVALLNPEYWALKQLIG